MRKYNSGQHGLFAIGTEFRLVFEGVFDSGRPGAAISIDFKLSFAVAGCIQTIIADGFLVMVWQIIEHASHKFEHAKPQYREMLLTASCFHPAAIAKGHRFLFMVHFHYLAVVKKAAGQILGSPEKHILLIAIDGLKIAVEAFTVLPPERGRF